VSTLRSEDWVVRPSFVPNGPTSPVLLLADETHFTQLAGIPAVAWQTPWSEITNIELVRFSHQMALFATVADVRYCWRNRELTDYDALRAVVVAHGGLVTRRRRRVGVVAIVAVVVLASFAGGIAAWFNRGSAGQNELADARFVNLTQNDLPSGFSPTTSSETFLGILVPPSGQVYTSTTTTAPAKNSTFTKAATIFQSCLGITNAADRIYGAAGQEPDYQVSSPIFNTSALGGVELASTTQYYNTTTMVKKDTHEMAKANFGSCFVKSSAALVLSAYGTNVPVTAVATSWHPMTFAKGWSRGGYIALKVPNVASQLQLVMAVMTRGHYEVTLTAIVSSFSKTERLLTNTVNTLLSRMSNSSATAA
jgi:hypothetical protein